MSWPTFFEHMRIDFPVLVMTLLVLVSSVAVVYTKHAGRSEFVALQQLENRRDQLNEEWGKLLLEQSTWASPARVELQSRTRLNMQVPNNEQTVVVKP
ncbi:MULTISPECIES: cell division protein FtsL [unclassified Methylophaga]|jgi:cell division protein FtsL|uniref:cell division protein FtsL n=1 Tax=unclassified Methylophaga TaxID=2629249 RepID=UPI000C8FA30C|nr:MULTISPECIES: cell division protein FtsL [unclassified Methylophaga]MAK66941.1 cell division protein FtsL [Methylophaga sp.]MAY17977.1 cell division protein FtsL [Methylophaga sp.]MBN47187.1 cell division protein FtsL [Methylophaga sp.]HAO24877.1 cell division protein FtsL [Methylophaga sp.]|tara:strand:- start:14433 stop:14726 length:294 start_codon:yes stop_codon:yes gene_type:complete